MTSEALRTNKISWMCDKDDNLATTKIITPWHWRLYSVHVTQDTYGVTEKCVPVPSGCGRGHQTNQTKRNHTRPARQRNIFIHDKTPSHSFCLFYPLLLHPFVLRTHLLDFTGPGCTLYKTPILQKSCEMYSPVLTTIASFKVTREQIWSESEQGQVYSQVSSGAPKKVSDFCSMARHTAVSTKQIHWSRSTMVQHSTEETRLPTLQWTNLVRLLAVWQDTPPRQRNISTDLCQQ